MSIRGHVARGTVAFGAAGLLVFYIAMGCDVADHDRMAANAVMLKLLQIGLSDPDRFVKVLKRERLRMVPAILGFDEILVWEGRRDMAVVATGDTMMAGFHPGVVLVIHDVAVFTGGGVIAEVGEAFGEMKGEQRQSSEHPEADGRSPACK
jgi:hypothetical protein